MSNRRFMASGRQIATMAVLLAAVSAAVPAAAAEPTTGAGETHGDLVVFPGNFEPLVAANDTRPEPGGPGNPTGWHIPGRSYLGGDGWWALVCGSEASETLVGILAHRDPDFIHCYNGFRPYIFCEDPRTPRGARPLGPTDGELRLATR
jgi:hypothetical protein